MSGNVKEKLIIDTDCGVDDAQAILIALSEEFSHRIEVIGITCCSGNVDVNQVVVNVLKVLTVAQRLDIPVYKGACDSLLPAGLDASHYHGKDGLGDIADIPKPDLNIIQKEHAVNYLVRITHEHPGEITLLTLAPLTNVALACRMDPTFGKNFKRLVIMGGNYQGQGNITICSEFNFHFDPEAALIVLDEFSCPIILATWEMCVQFPMSHKFMEQCYEQGTVKSVFLKKITSKSRQLHSDGHFGMSKNIVLCDEIAAAIMVDPMVALNQKNVFASVEVQGKYTRGQMVVDWRNRLSKRKNVFIVTEIDIERLKLILTKAMQ